MINFSFGSIPALLLLLATTANGDCELRFGKDYSTRTLYVISDNYSNVNATIHYH